MLFLENCYLCRFNLQFVSVFLAGGNFVIGIVDANFMKIYEVCS